LIKDKGWTSGLTEIQKKAIPVLLNEEDCIIEAPTAGGKTEAVLFPTFTNAAKRKTDSIQVLYLAPLRALLNDIETRAEKYASACGLHSFKWHGDVNQKDKVEAIQEPPQVLLTTPESLEAILLRKSEWVRLFSNLQSIIIDEAHNFASSDRGSHIAILLERIESKINKKPQRIALSATIGNPDDMLKWLAGKNRNPGKRISVRSTKEKPKDFQVRYFFSDGKDGEEFTPDHLRLYQLYDSLQQRKSLVFSPSRKKAEESASAINLINEHRSNSIPVRIRTHHSSVSKFYREYAEERIKIKNDIDSGLNGIISTSTLELGIDVGELDQVIQMDALSSSSAFLQRVGRTGRRPGKPQVFRGLTVKEEDLLLLAAVVNLGLKGQSEDILFPGKSFHILAHQVICLSLQEYGIHKDRAWDILSGAHCFRKVEYKDYEHLIAYMLHHDFLRDVDGEFVVGEETEKFFLGNNWRKLFAVFESGPLYDVISNKDQVGTLDEAFVETQEVPFYFILGGIEWEAYKIDDKKRQVFARKTSAGNAPRWQTFPGKEVPCLTAREVGEMVTSGFVPDFLDEGAKDCFESLQMQYKHLDWNRDQWLFVEEGNAIHIWTFAGERVNRTLAKLIEAYDFGKASVNYMNIQINPSKKGERIDSDELHQFITGIEGHNFSRYKKILERSVRSVPFTKFTPCLPDNLLRKTLVEKSFDLEGLIAYLKVKELSRSEN
jgi:ATP-dependent Lhr-like helicase